MSAKRHIGLCGVVHFGAASLTMAGETKCGDQYLVQATEAGALVAVVDGIGHGEEAFTAARTAVDAIVRHGVPDIADLFRICHSELRRTRGAVMSIGCFDGQKNLLTWLGVGNVEGYLYRVAPDGIGEPSAMFLNSGVVGYRMSSARTVTLPVAPGDLLILTTDGIGSGFIPLVTAAYQPQWLAEWICKQYANSADDGLVLVARYVGCPS